ncbi:hypothetical protein NW762_013346 [Fusarium torreyae]|uniref:Mid2 domain-containing protein n=1 Tax=Fusarium torreyae TaxID=1237075 RepID=A0A9W8VAJ2_9HYPO|nr:hypothetical protein NW762_013346 [Fusarium torreyae]
MRPANFAGLALLCLSSTALAQSDTCFGVDKSSWKDNKKCPNSSACCGINAKCMDNRLCKNPNSPENEFVRGPCAVAPYDRKKCAAICVYSEKNGIFPRAYKCKDGSFCCDDDPGCCDDGRGQFLDNQGNIVDDPNATTSSEPTTASAETTSATASSFVTATSAETSDTDAAESTQTSDSTSDDSSDDNKGVKIGVGVAVPVAVIGIALGSWFFFRNRRKRASVVPQEEKTPELAAGARPAELGHNPHKPPTAPQELPG